MGWHLLRNVLAGVLRIFLRAAHAGPAARSQGDPQPLLDVRRPGADFRGRDSQQVSAVAFHDRSRHRLGQHALHAVFHSCRIVAPRKNWSLHGDFQLLHRDSRNHGVAWIRLGDGASSEQQPHCRSGGGRSLLHAGGDIDPTRAGFVRLAAGERFVTGKRSRGQVLKKEVHSSTHRPRTATSSDSTGTPRAIFTRTRASKGLIVPELEPGIARSNFSTESWRQTNSTAPCVPNVVVPARIITYRPGPTPGISPTTE